jgi:hypothetical protein
MSKTLLSIAIIMAFICHCYADGNFYGNNTFNGPGTLTIQSGVQIKGTWIWAAGSVVNLQNATVTLPQFEPALGNPASNALCLQSTVSGVRSWGACGGGVGGGNPPGNPNGSYQWNNAGVFAGSSSITQIGGETDIANTVTFFKSTAGAKVNLDLSQLPSASLVALLIPNSVTGTAVAVQPDTAATAHNFYTYIDGLGIPHRAPPAAADLSDLGTNVLTALQAPVNGLNGIVTPNGQSTLTNKAVSLRTDSSTAGTSTTWSPNANSTDLFELGSPLSVAVTVINSPSGTPSDGQRFRMRIQSDGSAHALTWSGLAWHASPTGPQLPTTTSAGKRMYLMFSFNPPSGQWDLLALQDGF